MHACDGETDQGEPVNNQFINLFIYLNSWPLGRYQQELSTSSHEDSCSSSWGEWVQSLTSHHIPSLRSEWSGPPVERSLRDRCRCLCRPSRMAWSISVMRWPRASIWGLVDSCTTVDNRILSWCWEQDDKYKPRSKCMWMYVCLCVCVSLCVSVCVCLCVLIYIYFRWFILSRR